MFKIMIIFWCHAVTTVGKARGGKDSQKVGPDYHFVLGPLFWECPPLPWDLALLLHTWKKNLKMCIFKNSKFLQIFNLENKKTKNIMSENSLFSLKKIGQTFEKSFFFSFFFGKKIIGKLMRHVFYSFL